MRPRISVHDFETKRNRIIEFLKEGSKVKAAVMFRGRENTHPELGLKLLDRMWEGLKEISSVEKQPTREGARLHIILTPLASQKNKVKEDIEKEEQNAEA